MKKTIEVVKVDGCVIRDDRELDLARLHEDNGKVRVEKLPACSLGTYLYILDYLKELGFELYSE